MLAPPIKLMTRNTFAGGELPERVRKAPIGFGGGYVDAVRVSTRVVQLPHQTLNLPVRAFASFDELSGLPSHAAY